MIKKLLKHLPLYQNRKEIKLLQITALFLRDIISVPFTILKHDLDCYLNLKNNFNMDNSMYLLIN
jgi:hypothetical protein